MPTKAPTKTQTLMAHIVINELQAEAKLERALRRFSADDDLLAEDSYSAALPVEVH